MPLDINSILKYYSIESKLRGDNMQNQDAYISIKRSLIIGSYFSSFIIFCLFGISLSSLNMFFLQCAFLLLYVYFYYVYIKNTNKTTIPHKSRMIEFISIPSLLILTILYSLIFVDVKLVNNEYNGASLSHTYILFILIALYVALLIFSTRNTKRYV